MARSTSPPLRRQRPTRVLCRYLMDNPDNVALYPKLKGVDPKSLSGSTDTNVENVAKQYVQVFDDVISSVEANPADATEACKRLNSVGKLHRVKVSGMESTHFQALEQPFLYMVSEVLQDRFTDKAEQLFKKFFQFCLQYLTEGFNG
uniref:GLOBIN domain-containing protein n=2 Tax=Steinernema glaseri TaxID=37863 RepID=A0A1I7YIN6_9BILA